MNAHGVRRTIIILAVVVLAVGAGMFIVGKTHIFGSAAERAGSELAGSNCSGTGPVTLSVSPMKAEDISSIIPYGLMVNQHVTPIDHQYFAPLSYDSPRDAYEVRAPADGRIVSIQHRTSDYASFTHGRTTDEYRVVIDHTCTFLSYFDLITSLSPEIQSQVGKQEYVNVNIPVKAGQVIGKIGGQTLDFAVWDTTKTLSGFLVPDRYKNEPWKIHTVDPLDYATPELKAFMLRFNPRKSQPVSGKIDYDKDGTLAGNWFLKGQSDNTSNDQNNLDSWKNEFAFAPNNYDPSLWEISSGAWGENAGQFAISAAQPRPDSVGVQSGLVKYDLYQVQLLADGKMMNDERSLNGKQIITAKAGGQFMGCMLIQLTTPREMKAEGFPKQPCATLTGFNSDVKTYER